MPEQTKTASARTTRTRRKTAGDDAPSAGGSAPIAEIVQPFVFSADFVDAAVTFQNGDLVDFALPNTMPGAVAKVRLINPNSTDDIAGFPKDILEYALKSIRIDPATGDATFRDDMPAILDESGTVTATGLELMQMEIRMIDAIAIRGFVEPRLIESESDRSSPSDVLVDVISPRDRRRFYELCVATYSEANATARTFLQPSAGSVANR
jgi:hypothetical protein